MIKQGVQITNAKVQDINVKCHDVLTIKEFVMIQFHQLIVEICLPKIV